MATDTDATGIAGFLNIPPGDYVATATLAATGKPVSQVYVTLQKGTVTGALMWPTP
jgi:hypothetical protein